MVTYSGGCEMWSRQVRSTRGKDSCVFWKVEKPVAEVREDQPATALILKGKEKEGVGRKRPGPGLSPPLPPGWKSKARPFSRL